MATFLPNFFLAKKVFPFLFDKKMTLSQRWGWHYFGGVCAFGVMTNILLLIYLVIQFILLVKGKEGWVYKQQTFGIILISLFFMGQLVANSSLDYYVRYKIIRAGFFEYMLLFYVCQILFFYYIEKKK